MKSSPCGGELVLGLCNDSLRKNSKEVGIEVVGAYTYEPRQTDGPNVTGSLCLLRLDD